MRNFKMCSYKKIKSLKVVTCSLLALLAGYTSASFAETEITPAVIATRDVAPEYPESALRRDASGYVVIRFDIDESGKAKNLEIVDSEPARLFDAAVKKAVKKSDFEITNNAERVNDVERMYRFAPANETSLTMN